MEHVKRTLGNFQRVPNWSTEMNKKEVDYMTMMHSDSLFCGGKLRKIVIDHISDNLYKVYTIPF